MAEPAYRTGDLLARRYRVDGLLERGVLADLYAATDLGLQRPVALKVAAGHPPRADVASELLLREAHTSAGLRHPNIASVRDHGRTLRGTAFLVMEPVTGPTLSEFLARNGALPWRVAAAITMQIASGLSAAHARGVVHGALSPTNVLVACTAHGGLSCKLSEFGSARHEALHGKADALLDLHALGVILAATLRSGTQDTPVALTALATSLQAVDPEARPVSAAAVIAALRLIIGASEPAAASRQPPPPVAAPSRLAWCVLGVAVALAAGALLLARGLTMPAVGN